MKITQIIYSLDMGGIEEVAFSLANAFASSRIENSIVITSNSKDKNWCSKKTSQLVENDVSIIDVSNNNKIVKLLKSIKYLKENKTDLIFIHHEKMTAKIAMIKFFCKCHIIQIQHSSEVKDSIFHRFIGKYIISKYVAVSKQVKDNLIKKYHIDKRNVEVIYNGIDSEKFSFTRENKSNVIALGAVGRLVKSKNFIKLITLFNSINNKNSRKLRLLIAGDGEEKEHLIKLINNNPEIQLLGNVVDMPAFYKKIDIYISLSEFEGLSISLLEAMAAGCTIFVSNCSGHREVIIHKDNGVLFNIGEIENIADSLIPILSNFEKMKHLSKNAKITAHEYDIKKTISAYLKLVSNYGIL